MSLIHIEQLEKGKWKTIYLDKVQHKRHGIIVGGHFRILVDEEVIYDNKEVNENG